MLQKGNITTKSDLSEITKIIFLNINGVLNNVNSSTIILHVMEPELLELLKQLLDKVPGSALVLSSTLRYREKTRLDVLKSLEDAGLPPFLSCTPYLYMKECTNIGNEILYWMTENTNFNVDGWKDINMPVRESIFPGDLPKEKYTLKSRLENITHFIVLDDKDLNKEKNTNIRFITPRFIHIDKTYGLTQEDVNKAIELLNN